MEIDIVACARGWVGTRFHHQGRLKKTNAHKGGVDCLGLLMGVAEELDLPFAGYDDTSYPHYPDTLKLRLALTQAMLEVEVEDIKAGDILLLSIEGSPQHLAVVSEMASDLAIIHAYAPARAVVEHILDDWWRERIVGVFRVH
jgi:hypothetical protein